MSPTFYHEGRRAATTNEELAGCIQAGEREKLPELWAQVERFVRLQAYRRARSLNSLGGATAEDYYQSGWLALCAAVESYDPMAGKFLPWLALQLRTSFAEAGGYRSRKQSRDPIHRAHSLDAPLGDDPDIGTLEDTIEDPAGLQRLQEAEAGMDIQSLHDVLETALTALPEDQRAAIRAKYYRGQTVDNKAHAAALRALRHPRVSKALRPYL